jgi:hypothetical protein
MPRTKEASEATLPRKGDRHTIEIRASFGSDYQRDVSLRTLKRLLSSWKEITESHHKKNVITIVQTRG